jgi:hypothetical protein
MLLRSRSSRIVYQPPAFVVFNIRPGEIDVGIRGPI